MADIIGTAADEVEGDGGRADVCGIEKVGGGRVEAVEGEVGRGMVAEEGVDCGVGGGEEEEMNGE